MSLFTMPAGDYFIGDPCSVLNRKNWKRFTEVTPGVVHSCNGHNCLSFYTKYGDGIYHDNEGYTYGVDSGTIGIIHVDAMDASIGDVKKGGTGRIVRFPVSFLVRLSKKESVIDFGGVVVIDTDPDIEQ